jgi:hypothetical protein
LAVHDRELVAFESRARKQQAKEKAMAAKRERGVREREQAARDIRYGRITADGLTRGRPLKDRATAERLFRMRPGLAVLYYRGDDGKVKTIARDRSTLRRALEEERL